MRWSRLLVICAICAPTAVAARCIGDCTDRGAVSVGDIRLAVEIALERRPLGECDSVDASGDALVTVDEILLAVRDSLIVACEGGTPTPSASPTPTSSPAPTATLEPQPPLDTAALVSWLQNGSYRGWHAESQIHASAGPHFGHVRTFLNDAVFTSLDQASAAHPRGAALVKELYGASGDKVLGWSVMIKTDDDSASGVGWFWFERFNGTTFAAGNGVGLCLGCHGQNFGQLTTRDYVLTPFPLQ